MVIITSPCDVLWAAAHSHLGSSMNIQPDDREPINQAWRPNKHALSLESCWSVLMFEVHHNCQTHDAPRWMHKASCCPVVQALDPSQLLNQCSRSCPEPGLTCDWLQQHGLCECLLGHFICKTRSVPCGCCCIMRTVTVYLVLPLLCFISPGPTVPQACAIIFNVGLGASLWTYMSVGSLIEQQCYSGLA